MNKNIKPTINNKNPSNLRSSCEFHITEAEAHKRTEILGPCKASLPPTLHYHIPKGLFTAIFFFNPVRDVQIYRYIYIYTYIYIKDILKYRSTIVCYDIIWPLKHDSNYISSFLENLCSILSSILTTNSSAQGLRFVTIWYNSPILPSLCCSSSVF